MSNEMRISDDIVMLESRYESYCFMVNGGIWKFDKNGIRFERDDGKEIPVVILEDEE